MAQNEGKLILAKLWGEPTWAEAYSQAKEQAQACSYSDTDTSSGNTWFKGQPLRKAQTKIQDPGLDCICKLAPTGLSWRRNRYTVQRRDRNKMTEFNTKSGWRNSCSFVFSSLISLSYFNHIKHILFHVCWRMGILGSFFEKWSVPRHAQIRDRPSIWSGKICIFFTSTKQYWMQL